MYHKSIPYESTPIQLFLIYSEYCQEVRDRAFRNNRNVPKEYVLIPIVGIWSDDLIQIASV